jgi:hypothetical protein
MTLFIPEGAFRYLEHSLDRILIISHIHFRYIPFPFIQDREDRYRIAPIRATYVAGICNIPLGLAPGIVPCHYFLKAGLSKVFCLMMPLFRHTMEDKPVRKQLARSDDPWTFGTIHRGLDGRPFGVNLLLCQTRTECLHVWKEATQLNAIQLAS